MTATLQIDPKRFTERSLQLVLTKAQEWGCSPAEAVAKLLDEAAKRKSPKISKQAD